MHSCSFTHYTLISISCFIFFSKHYPIPFHFNLHGLLLLYTFHLHGSPYVLLSLVHCLSQLIASLIISFYIVLIPTSVSHIPLSFIHSTSIAFCCISFIYTSFFNIQLNPWYTFTHLFHWSSASPLFSILACSLFHPNLLKHGAHI